MGASHWGSGKEHSRPRSLIHRRSAAATWAASAAGLTRPELTLTRQATAASTACDTAQSSSRADPRSPAEPASRTASSLPAAGSGISQPVRWASTASSAQSTSPGVSSRNRCAARMSRSVHGAAWQSGPHVPDRGDTTTAGDAVTTEPAASRAVPSGIAASTGKSIPSANTAACPGGRVTRYRDCAPVRFMVAPTVSRSSAAGSRCTILTAVFLITSGMSLAGICSAMTRPSP